MLETLQHRNRLTSYGVGFRSFTEAYLDSCGLFKDAVIAILAVIAKPERIRLSEGTKAGLAAARRKGKVLGRRRAVDLARVASLRSQGLTLRAIATEMGYSRSLVHKTVSKLAPRDAAVSLG